jgi:hypothetical protein
MDARLPAALVLLQAHNNVYFDRLHHVLGTRERRRALWVRSYLTEERRRDSSHYYTLLNEGRIEWDELVFRNYTRVNLPIFLEILDRIREGITRRDTHLRAAIEPGLKLAVALGTLLLETASGHCPTPFEWGSPPSAPSSFQSVGLSQTPTGRMLSLTSGRSSCG